MTKRHNETTTRRNAITKRRNDKTTNGCVELVKRRVELAIRGVDLGKQRVNKEYRCAEMTKRHNETTSRTFCPRSTFITLVMIKSAVQLLNRFLNRRFLMLDLIFHGKMTVDIQNVKPSSFE